MRMDLCRGRLASSLRRDLEGVADNVTLTVQLRSNPDSGRFGITFQGLRLKSAVSPEPGFFRKPDRGIQIWSDR